jgi:hypothetical protein
MLADDRTVYNSPSPSVRELEVGGFHPHLNLLPSRERNFIQDCGTAYELPQRQQRMEQAYG